MEFKDRLKQIAKGNFGLAFSQNINPANYSGGMNVSDIPFEVLTAGTDGVNAFYSWVGIESSLTAYEKCPPLKAVCNRRALAYANGQIKVLNSLGNPSLSAQAKRVMKLLKNPNKFQTGSSFKMQVSIYMDLVGYVVIIPLNPVGYDLSHSESLWVVPPTMVEFVTSSNKLNLTTGGIDYVKIGGVRVNPDSLIIIQDTNPSVDNIIIPSSNIKTLQHPINNIIGAYQSESNLIKHRGPTTLISNQVNPQLGAPLPIDAKEKESVQRTFNASYGFLDGQSNTLITNASLNVQQVGFDAAQLRLHESLVANTKSICDTIGYPAELLAITDSKYDNMQQADLNLYTKFIMPRAKNIDEQLGSYFLSDNDNFYTDYSNLPELQADGDKTANIRLKTSQSAQIDFRNDIITKNQYLKIIGLPEVGTAGDVYFSSLKPMLDNQAVQTIANTQNA